MRISPSGWLCALALVAASPLATAGIIYDADFEGLTVGTALPTGAPPGLPASIDPNLAATVQDAAALSPSPALTDGNFVRLEESEGEAPNLAFDAGTSWTAGIVTVSMDLLFESLESHQIVFREGSGVGGAAIQMADILTDSGGGMTFISSGATVGSATYAAGQAIHLEAVFDLDNDTWDALLDGVLVVDDAPVLDEALGLVGIGFRFSGFTPGPNQDGIMQLDNFRLVAPDAAVPEPPVALLLAVAAVAVPLRRARWRA